MRLDFTPSLSALFLIGMGGFAGEFIVSIVGLPTNDAIIGGAVTLLLGSVGAGTIIGTARQRRGEEADEEGG